MSNTLTSGDKFTIIHNGRKRGPFTVARVRVSSRGHRTVIATDGVQQSEGECVKV